MHTATPLLEQKSRGVFIYAKIKCLRAYSKRRYMRRVHCAGRTSVAGCKPNCCTQPRAAPWGNDVALIKVSRSVRATCFMRGNAPCGVKGVYGLRAFGAWHFCASAKMPNVSIAVYVSPGRCPGLWATFGLTARPNHLPGVLQICSYSCNICAWKALQSVAMVTGYEVPG